MNKIDHQSACAISDTTETVSEMISANPSFGFHSIGSDGLFIQISQTELDWLGYRREEVIGKLGFYDLLTDEDKKRFSERFPVFQETGIVRDVDYNWVSKDGSIVPISVSGTAIKNKFGEFVSTVAVIINLSQRKQAESTARRVALLKQREELHEFLDHDLKNPMNSANKLIELLLAGGAGPITEAQKTIFNDLKYTNKRILKKMKVMREVHLSEEYPHPEGSKMVNAKEIFAQQVPLWKVIEGCVIRMAQTPEFTEKKLSFNLDLNSSSIIVDTHAFERLIGHLLDNAARFSPSEGVIEISCVRTEKYFELSVGDEGPGIAEKFVPKLFDYQLDQPADELAGLGLFLCARIAEAYGGTISYRKELQSGAKMTVHIPMS